jgi:GntR family transcriptional regulator
MYAGGQPMQLATSYVPWSFAEGTQMVERDSGPGGIYSRLADVGHGPSAGLQPVPDGLRESGAPVEVCEHVMSGDRWLLTYEWAAE